MVGSGWRLINSDSDGGWKCHTNEGDGEDEGALQMWLFVSYASVVFDTMSLREQRAKNISK